MELIHAKGERAVFKILLWTIGTLFLSAVLVVAGYHQVRAWQVRRLSAEANALVDRADYKRAGLEARRILQIDPESVTGLRIMARIAEGANSRMAVELWRRVTGSGSASADDWFALARTATRFGDLKTAEGALAKLPAASGQSARYHAAQADLALGQRDGAKVERELSESVRLEPENKEYVFRLAILRLGASASELREKARQTLRELQSDKNLRREATRQLVNDALRSRNFPDALTLARQLNQFPEKDFRDRLLLLSVLNEAKDAGFQNFLAETEAAAAQDPDAAAGLISWLNTHQMAQEAITWSREVKPEVLAQKSVPIALADSFISARDWTDLERLTSNGNWGEFDFLRAALRARALREQNQLPKFSAQWSETVQKVSANAETALMLAQTAWKWGWRDEAIDLLWLVTKDRTKAEAALQTLYNAYIKTGDTQNLYRVLIHLFELRPDDRDIENNLAQVSLLLNLNAERGQELARDVYNKAPRNPAYASTYAFALYARGQTKDALRVFSRFSETQLRQPAIALYCGIILAAAGDSERAAAFLDLVQKENLLPEEKALFEKAQHSPAQP